MSAKQCLGVQVIGAEHYLFGVITDQWSKYFKVSGSTSLAYQDFHSA